MSAEQKAAEAVLKLFHPCQPLACIILLNQPAELRRGQRGLRGEKETGEGRGIKCAYGRNASCTESILAILQHSQLRYPITDNGCSSHLDISSLGCKEQATHVELSLRRASDPSPAREVKTDHHTRLERQLQPELAEAGTVGV